MRIIKASIDPQVVQESLIVNGNMDHFQRGTGARTATTTYDTWSSYAADRFFVRPVGASVTAQRSATVPDTNSQFSLLVTGAASVTTADIGQRIRSAVAFARARQSLLFRTWVHNVSGAAFSPVLRIGTAGAVDNFTTVTERTPGGTGIALPSCPNNAWTLLAAIVDPSAYTNLTNGIEVALRVPSGVLVAGNTVRVSQFDLRPGTRYSPYITPDPDVQLALAQRACRVYGGNSANEALGVGPSNGTTQTYMGLFFPPMYFTPVLPAAGFTPSDFQVLNGGAAGFAVSAISLNSGYSGPGSAYVTITHSTVSGVANDCLVLAAANTNARLPLIAEY